MKDYVLNFLGNLVRDAEAATLRNDGRIAASLETIEYIRSLPDDQSAPQVPKGPADPSSGANAIEAPPARKPNGRNRPEPKNLSDLIRDILKERGANWTSVAAFQIQLEKDGVKATQDQIMRVLVREKAERVVLQTGRLFRLRPLRPAS